MLSTHNRPSAPVPEVGGVWRRGLDLVARPLSLVRVALALARVALATRARPALWVALAWLAALTGFATWAQEPGAPFPPKPPTLVALGTRSGLAAQAGAWRALLAADPLLDLGVQARTIPADSPDGRALGARLRRSWNLGPSPAVWGLLDGQGEPLAAGGALPEAEALAQVLEAAGLRSPVRLLQTFLRARPDHAEARLDLVRALGPRIRARLTELEPGELAPDLDDRIWGPLAQELDLLFRTADWSSLNLNLDRELLLQDRPERFSPRMRALYRRHLPQLRADLLRCPQNPHVWSSLLRMEQVLGEHTLLATLAAVPWFQVRPAEAAALPYGPMAQSVHREATRTGAWRQAMTVELALWRQLVRPKLCFFGSASQLPPGAGAEARQPWLTTERETIWTHLLAPLIEAMVRAGAEGEVPALLGELDASWSGLAWPNRFQRLARTLARPDLPRVWLAAVQQGATGAVLERLPAWDRVLLVQGQTQAPREPGEAPLTRAAFARPFRRLGMTFGLQPAPPAWRQLLGWTGAQPRWALVDAQGQVLLQGDRLPAAERFMADYLAQGLPVDLDRVLAFRQDHPEHLGALAAEVRIRGTIAWAHQAERRASSTPGRLDGAETEAWRAYVRTVESLLQEPMGTTPGLLRTAQVQVPGPEDWGAEAGAQGLDALAVRLLPRLEADLARRPSDQDLWWLWLAFAPYQGRSMAALLQDLAPSPMTPSGAWPAHGVLVAGASSLREAERWQEVVDLLLPRWQAGAAAVQQQLLAKPGARYGFSQNWSWELTRPLLEALLHLGQAQDADTILETLETAGGRRPGAMALRPLCDLARDLGLDSWARRWQGPGAP